MIRFSLWRQHVARYPLTAVLTGLLIAQIIASLQVYLSNRALYHTLVSIRDAGYLTVPTEAAMDRLQDMAPAVWGGLFFTLSAGAGISLVSLAAVWIWDRLFRRSRRSLIFLLLVWAGSMTAVNWEGWSPLTTAYFALIPIGVFRVAVSGKSARTVRDHWFLTGIHAAAIGLLVCLWGSQMGKDLFVNIRDRLLLSNPIGAVVSDFYYQYTLYPAQVFKSLNQKTLKTCSLDGVGNSRLKELLAEKLLAYDYLPIKGGERVDLEISGSGEGLIFGHRGEAILKTTAKDFLSAPHRALEQFSLRTDKNRFFRGFSYFGLLIGFPLTLYLFAYTLVMVLATLFFQLNKARVLADILCVVIGICLLMPLLAGHHKAAETVCLSERLTSDPWQERVAALKWMEDNGGDVSRFPAYRQLLSSRRIQERYWLAKAMGVSRAQNTYEDLMQLLDDPCPSVVCMALQSLGRRGDSGAIQEILRRIRASDHWYVQWYGYRALKRLGWKQSASE